ncbi:hypothetical protein DFQ29_002537 [Apophysomyces sp. BC1021]|nr:hypothetical protein DFQ29_002537 [Apophysomyces sp. BC1021]
MSMDIKLNWENDLDDTSYRGSSPTCSISSAGPLKESLETLTRLGSQMSTISEGSVGPYMVGDLGEAGEWVTHSEGTDRPQDYSLEDLSGHVQYGLGIIIIADLNIGSMDRFRKRHFDQCQGTEDDPICIVTPHKKLRGETFPYLYRQHDYPEVCLQGGRHSVRDSTRSCSPNPRDYQMWYSPHRNSNYWIYPFSLHLNKGLQLSRSVPCYQLAIQHQQTQTTDSISPYSGSTKYSGRPFESTETDSAVRSTATEEMVQESRAPLGPTHNRCLRNSRQLPEKTVREPQTRPRSRINRCVFPTMAKTRTVLISSLEANSESVTSVPDTEHKGSSSSDPTLEDTILVPGGSAIHPGAPDPVQSEPQVAASR